MGKNIGKRQGYLVVDDDWKPGDDWLPRHKDMKEARSNKSYWDNLFKDGSGKRIIKATVIYEELEENNG